MFAAVRSTVVLWAACLVPGANWGQTRSGAKEASTSIASRSHDAQEQVSADATTVRPLKIGELAIHPSTQKRLYGADHSRTGFLGSR